MCENQNYFLSNENVEDNEPQKEEYFLLEVKLNDDGTAKLTWWEMADKLGEAVVAAQGWSADWVIDASTTGGHDYFGADQDAVAGVTFGIDHNGMRCAANASKHAAQGGAVGRNIFAYCNYCSPFCEFCT